ncbi:hypothetical protein HNQ10_002631 [Deinococcus metallilatus]|uniref:Uncharacterized protein n=1 Tax=Deinococcus metallilatus TaxID=1211322 RepID=A0ABR6MV19_9DEIO|nr:hypothetical protein [Deinococcus metallilatus]
MTTFPGRCILGELVKQGESRPLRGPDDVLHE